MTLKLDGEEFCCGRSIFDDTDPSQREPTAKLFVKNRFGSRPEVFRAQLDTGSPWSILGVDIARAVGVGHGSGEPTTLLSHGGPVAGHLERVAITFPADEGESLNIEGTFLVTPSLPQRLFLGYSGLLESIRFAVDAQANWFFFGHSTGRP